MNHRHELRRRTTDRRLDICRHIRLGEASQRETLDQMLSPELGERSGERMAARQVDVPVGAHDQETRIAQVLRHELEEPERARVRRIEILEHEHDRPGCGGPLQKRGERVEQSETGLLLVGERRCRLDVPETARHLGHDLSHRHRTCAQLGA